MSDQAKEDMPCGGSSTGMSTAPLYRLPSRIFNQDLGLPPFLGLDWLPRGLPVYSWPGFAPAPLFVPHIAGSVHQPSQKIPKWRVGMDVAHFSPSEISVSLKDEFLEVKGKHGERPDEHGFIARCFIRKYRLPAEVDATKITSTLSADGILTVEAPVPEAFVPAAVIIPIKVETESSAEKPVNQEEEVLPREADGCRAPQDTQLPSSQDRSEEIRGDQVQTGSSTAGVQQPEDKRGQEEEENPEVRVSKPAEDEGLQDSSSEQYEVLESPESLDMSKEPEEEGPVEGGEIQAAVGSVEAAGTSLHEEQELKGPQSEPQSQELEADIQQE